MTAFAIFDGILFGFLARLVPQLILKGRNAGLLGFSANLVIGLLCIQIADLFQPAVFYRCAVAGVATAIFFRGVAASELAESRVNYRLFGED